MRAHQIYALIILVIAPMSFSRGEDLALNSLMTAAFPPHVATLSVEQRQSTVRRLLSEQKFAKGKEAQQINFILAELGVNYESNKDALIHAVHACVTSEQTCNEDTTSFLISLYEDGHEELLHALFQAGIGSDGATAAALGSFYLNILKSDPTSFMSSIQTLSKEHKAILCQMAGRGDGGGISRDDLRTVRKGLRAFPQCSCYRLSPRGRGRLFGKLTCSIDDQM